jgi:phage tail-like protein
MATVRDTPYGAYNFLVEIDGVTSAGFSEVSGLSVEIGVIDYRNGNDKNNSVHKIPGLHKVGDVTLKRGIIGDTALFSWLRATAQGSSDVRNIAIILLDETHVPVMRWLLSRAWPSKWEAGALKATANEIAIETLTLICERIEID